MAEPMKDHAGHEDTAWKKPVRPQKKWRAADWSWRRPPRLPVVALCTLQTYDMTARPPDAPIAARCHVVPRKSPRRIHIMLSRDHPLSVRSLLAFEPRQVAHVRSVSSSAKMSSVIFGGALPLRGADVGAALSIERGTCWQQIIV